MKTPSYAAVNDAVKIAKILAPNYANFTNAILRKLNKDIDDKKYGQKR